ncbi:MAG: glycosyltransferase [Chitinophagales bacterium]|nr:glycosyltransferase [Hyphomicrobiales bacterium]
MSNPRKKLVVINFFPAFNDPTSGGEQRSLHLLRALAKRFEVHSISPTYEKTRDETVILDQHLHEHRFTKNRDYEEWQWSFREASFPVSAPAYAFALASPIHVAMKARVQELAQDADAIVLQHPAAWQVAKDIPGKPLFYLAHNCEFELAVNALASTEFTAAAAMLHQLEYLTCQAADGVFGCSQDDCLKYQILYGIDPSKTHVAGNGAEDRLASRAAEMFKTTMPRTALFVGSNWQPNVHAAKFIVEKLAPLCPDVEISIVGSVCASLDSSHSASNICLRNRISNRELGALMARTHVGLNPMGGGSGSNVKMADYLAHGMEVLSTPVGARGFPPQLANIHIASLDTFAESLATICANPPTPETRLGWRQAAQTVWDWNVIGAGVADRIAARLENIEPDEPHYDQRVLVMNEFPVAGHSNGGQARIAGCYGSPPERTLTTVVSFGRGPMQLNRLGNHVNCIELPVTAHQTRAVTVANKGAYATVNNIVLPQEVAKNPLFLAAVEKMAAHSDVIVLEHPFMMPVLERIGVSRPIIYSSHNVETELKANALATHPMRDALLSEVRRQEAAAVAQASMVIACSQSDADVYKAQGARHVAVVPNGVSRPALHAPLEPSHPQSRIAFVNDLTHDVAGIGALYRTILGREPSDEEAQGWMSSSLPACSQALMRSPENLNGRRGYAMGANLNGSARFTAVFMGSGHRPNLTAAELIARFVAPECPGVDILIVGSVCNSLKAAAFPDNVFLAGVVSDHDKSRILRGAQVGLNPVVEGGGSNLKVPDYMAHGLPVLSTPFGSRGYHLTEEDGLFCAEIPDFASVLQKLASNSFATRPTVNSHYVESLYWDRLSVNHYRTIFDAALHEQNGVLVVVEDSQWFDTATQPALRRHWRALGFDKARLIVQSELDLSLDFVALKSSFHEWSRHLTICRRDLAAFMTNASMPTHGLGRRRRHTRILLGEEPSPVDQFNLSRLGENFTLPIADKVAVRAFLSGATIHLPRDAVSISVKGGVYQAGYLSLHQGGRTLVALNASKGFHLLTAVSSSGPVKLMFDPGAAQSQNSQRQIAGHVSEIIVESGSLRKTMDLGSQPITGQATQTTRLAVDGCVAAGEDLLVGRELVAALLRFGPDAQSIVIAGSDAFTERLHAAAPCLSKKMTSMKAYVEAGDGKTALPLYDETELSLAVNGKLRNAHATKLSVNADSLLFLLCETDPWHAQIAVAAAQKIARISPSAAVCAIITGEQHAQGVCGQMRELLVAGNVQLLKTENYADILAAVGTARLTVVTGQAAHLWSRLPELSAISPFRFITLDVSGGQSCDVWKEYLPAFCFEDIIECYWRADARAFANGRREEGIRQ